MPRQRRIDFPGALHHVIIRGINRAAIFKDDQDRNRFVECLKSGQRETAVSCYAWVLIPNHIHLLLRTAGQPLTKLMRSLLTGYAVYFNRRHKRVGYLFQNRYKSILCDEEVYLLQLVRYIHLNPLRAGLVQNLRELNNFPWSGHAVLMGKSEAPWQDVEAILRRFGSSWAKGRSGYLAFVEKGIVEGRRTDLVGGGLIRSAGGWQAVQELRKAGERWRGDERILGDSDFVQKALRVVEEELIRKLKHKSAGWNLGTLTEYVAELFRLKAEDLKKRKRDYIRSQARAIFCWWATSELGYQLTEVAKFLNLTKQAVYSAARKGEEIAQKEKMKLPPSYLTI